MDPLAALAQLARRAVVPAQLGHVLQDAVEVLAEVLGVEHATVMELAPEGDDVRLRAGIGWEQGFIGRTVDAMPGGYVAFVLATGDPVVVDDLAAEQRFAPSPVLLGAGVKSSVAVRIPGAGERPYGVVGAHATEQRTFTAEEISFADAVATVLTGAIARHRQAVEINDEILQTLVLAQYAQRRGDEDAGRLLEQAVAQTRELINELLGDRSTPPLPGDLRRARGARAAPPRRA
jgi:GAF domain-containing protein